MSFWFLLGSPLFVRESLSSGKRLGSRSDELSLWHSSAAQDSPSVSTPPRPRPHPCCRDVTRVQLRAVLPMRK